MINVIIENLAKIVTALFTMLIGVLGAWLTSKLAKQSQLTSINAAQQEVIAMAQITVGELQQTVVERLKAAAEDGKLSKEEIADLGIKLVEKTKEKMSKTTLDFLNAVGVDVIALIHGAGEDWINSLKRES